MSFEIKNGIHWVGKVDWEIRKFHGDEYSTHRGTTYNSYLLKGEKNVLIETVSGPFAEEFVQKLAENISLQDIHYVVVNHAEPDHAGALGQLMREIPDTPIYCTKNALASIRGHHHTDWNFNPVKTGDKLDLGDRELIFVEMPMLHWPDSMACYLTGDNILFSNDAFGQHLASESLYNDAVDPCELWAEAMKYYANILTPFNPLVKRKIKEVLSLGLPVDLICPSHGVIWRDKPVEIIEKYLEWADDYQEDQITILYDSMWGATRGIAEAIGKGIKAASPKTTIKILNTASSDKNDCITEVFKSKGVLLGSPTINQGFLFSVGGILEQMRGLKFKGKKAAAFGSYGWSGESPGRLAEELGRCGFEVVEEGLKIRWRPDTQAFNRCFEFGRNFAHALD